MSNKSVFDELNAQIKAAEGGLPDTLTVGGVTYRKGAQPVGAVRRGKYVHPKSGIVEEDVELESVTINVAPYADRITLDGVIYLQGTTRDVPVYLARTLRDIMARTWQHEHQTGGANTFGTSGGVRNPGRLSSGLGYGQ